MNSIDNIVDKALNKSKLDIEEPKYVLVYNKSKTWKMFHWFKPWKMFKYETSSQDKAYEKFNAIMEQLSLRNNVVVDAKRSKVTLKDISPCTCRYVNLKYTVEVYWRDKEPRNGQ